MASYAKQADDKSLYNMAVRIRARAIRRCGDLLKQVEKRSGKATAHKSTAGDTFTRKKAAKQAGMSKRQHITAMRVANVPEEEFEADIESDNPSSIAELEAKGTKKQEKPLIDLQGRDPKEFQLATEAQGALRRFAEFANTADQAAVVRGSFPRERRELKDWASITIEWCKGLIRTIQEGEKDDPGRSRLQMFWLSQRPSR